MPKEKTFKKFLKNFTFYSSPKSMTFKTNISLTSVKILYDHWCFHIMNILTLRLILFPNWKL